MPLKALANTNCVQMTGNNHYASKSVHKQNNCKKEPFLYFIWTTVWKYNIHYMKTFILDSQYLMGLFREWASTVLWITVHNSSKWLRLILAFGSLHNSLLNSDRKPADEKAFMHTLMHGYDLYSCAVISNLTYLLIYITETETKSLGRM